MDGAPQPARDDRHRAVAVRETVVTVLVSVTVTAGTAEDAWRLAAHQMLAPFKRKRWHDSTETVLRLLVALRQGAVEQPDPITALDANVMPWREPPPSARWFTPTAADTSACPAPAPS